MKKIFTASRLLASVLVLALGILGASCSNSDPDRADPPAARDKNSSPGVTDTEIRFSIVGTRSNNPLGTCMLDCFTQGVNAYFAYRNAEGGIDGRQLTLTTNIDDQLGQNKQATLKIITDNDTFANFSAPMLATGWADLAKAGIPVYTLPWYPQDMNGHESIYSSTGVECITCTRRMHAYAAQTTGATRIATLGYGISQSSKDCADSAAESIRKYAPDTGQTLAYSNNGIAFGMPNGIGPEVSAMKAAGVQFIVSCFDINGQKTLAQELKRQGMADVPVSHSNSYDLAFMKEAGDLFEGDVIGITFRPFEASAEGNGLALFKKWMGEIDADLTEVAAYGWIAAQTAYEGIKAAGPGFTQASVIEATNRLTSFTAGGLVPPTDWSRQHTMPTQEDPATNGPKQECLSVLTYKGGKYQFTGGSTAEKPWVCWSNANRNWSDPVPANFE